MFVIVSIIVSLLYFSHKNKSEEEEIDWASLNQDQQSEKLVIEIPDSQVEELFETPEEEEEELLQRLQDLGLELPEGWTLETYSEWLKGPLPEGWAEEQWRQFSSDTLAIIESQQLF